MKGWLWPNLRRGSSSSARERSVTQTTGTPAWLRSALNSSNPGRIFPRTGMNASITQKTTVDTRRTPRLLDRCAHCSQGVDQSSAAEKEKAGRTSARLPDPGPSSPELFLCNLVTGGRASRCLRIRLGNADVSADSVLADLVDDHLFGNTRACRVEEDRLIHGAVLLLEALVLHRHQHGEPVVLLIYTLELNGDVSNLLRL